MATIVRDYLKTYSIAKLEDFMKKKLASGQILKDQKRTTRRRTRNVRTRRKKFTTNWKTRLNSLREMKKSRGRNLSSLNSSVNISEIPLSQMQQSLPISPLEGTSFNY